MLASRTPAATTSRASRSSSIGFFPGGTPGICAHATRASSFAAANPAPARRRSPCTRASTPTLPGTSDTVPFAARRPSRGVGSQASASGRAASSFGRSTSNAIASPRRPALPFATTRPPATRASTATSRASVPVILPRAVPASATPDRRDPSAIDASMSARHGAASAPVALTRPSSDPFGNAPNREGSNLESVARTSNASGSSSAIVPSPASRASPAVARSCDSVTRRPAIVASNAAANSRLRSARSTRTRCTFASRVASTRPAIRVVTSLPWILARSTFATSSVPVRADEASATLARPRAVPPPGSVATMPSSASASSSVGVVRVQRRERQAARVDRAGHPVRRLHGACESPAHRRQRDVRVDRGRGPLRVDRRQVRFGEIDGGGRDRGSREGRERGACAEVGAARAARRVDGDVGERPAQRRLRVDAGEARVAGERELARERERRGRAQRHVGRERSPVEHEGEVADPVLARARGIAERQAAHVARARPQHPVESPHRDAVDRERERQHERRRRRGRRVGSLHRDHDGPGAQPADVDAALDERQRRPVEREVVRLQLRLRSGPRDAPDAHRRQQRPFRAFDREAPFAAGDDLAHGKVERRLRPEEHECRARERDGDDRDRRGNRERHACPAPPRGAGRPLVAVGGAFHQNASPTEKCRRTLASSWPYATSTRNGPIGVRMRAPTP